MSGDRASDSTRMDVPLADRIVAFSRADADFRFAAAVAAFGMILKGSACRGEATLDWVLDTATGSHGQDPGWLPQRVRLARAESDRAARPADIY